MEFTFENTDNLCTVKIYFNIVNDGNNVLSVIDGLGIIKDNNGVKHIELLGCVSDKLLFSEDWATIRKVVIKSKGEIKEYVNDNIIINGMCLISSRNDNLNSNHLMHFKTRRYPNTDGYCFYFYWNCMPIYYGSVLYNSIFYFHNIIIGLPDNEYSYQFTKK